MSLTQVREPQGEGIALDANGAVYLTSEGKKGAGQYFTPRVLIQSIVRCMKPDPRVRLAAAQFHGEGAKVLAALRQTHGARV